MRGYKERKMFQLAFFIFVALTSGWLGVLLNSVLNEPPDPNNLGMGLWLVLPLLTVLLLRFISHDWYDFGINPRIKGNLKWYLLAIVIFPVVTIFVGGGAWIFNLAEPFQFETRVFISLVVASLLPSLIINIFEEFAWRGYLTPKLMELKVNDWLIYLIVGLVWALWHAAYFLVLLPNEYFETLSRVGYLWTGGIGMVIWSVMFVELYRITTTVWPGVLMHAAQDSFTNVLINNMNDGGVMVFSKLADPWLNPIYGVVTSILILAIGLWLRSVRIKKQCHVRYKQSSPEIETGY